MPILRRFDAQSKITLSLHHIIRRHAFRARRRNKTYPLSGAQNYVLNSELILVHEIVLAARRQKPKTLLCIVPLHLSHHSLNFFNFLCIHFIFPPSLVTETKPSNNTISTVSRKCCQFLATTMRVIRHSSISPRYNCND